MQAKGEALDKRTGSNQHLKTNHPRRSPKKVVPENIRVAYAPVVLNIPLYLGQSRGVFQSNSITVDAKVFTSANDMINAVIADQVDAVTGVSLVPILNLEAQQPGRVRVILHSRMTDEQPYDGLVVKKASPIQTLNDLKGHKAGLYPGTTALNLCHNLRFKANCRLSR